MKKTIIAILGFAALALASQAEAAGVPALKLVSACDSCTVPDDVAKSLQDGYVKEVGAPQDSAGVIEVKVTEFSARSGAARFALGVFSGKDKIATTFTVNGKALVAEDTARSSFCGIGCVASNVGENIGKQVAAALSETAKPDAPAATPASDNATLTQTSAAAVAPGEADGQAN